MLININPLLSPDLLSIMRSMGHGDRLILCDANYPAASTSNKVIRMDGVSIPKAAEAILNIFPLDSFIESPVIRMQIDGSPDEINEVQNDLIEIVETKGADVPHGPDSFPSVESANTLTGIFYDKKIFFFRDPQD